MVPWDMKQPKQLSEQNNTQWGKSHGEVMRWLRATVLSEQLIYMYVSEALALLDMVDGIRLSNIEEENCLSPVIPSLHYY